MPNISNFISSFSKTELARPSNFEVWISIPAALIQTNAYPEGMGKLRLRCEASELPARTFATVDQKTYGPIQVFPVQNYYDKTNLVFICSDDMQEKSFFDLWMDHISVSTRTGTNFDRLYFDFQYRQNYTTTIQINQYDLEGKISYTVSLLEAYPVAVNSLSLSWDAVNSVHKLPVTFSYRYFQLPLV